MYKRCRVCKIQVFRSDNASELNSAEVKQMYLEHSNKTHLPNSNPEQQFQNGKAKKCIGDVWTMTKVALLFSNDLRVPWDVAWTSRYAAAVKRHLLLAANDGFNLQPHMITGHKVSLFIFICLAVFYIWLYIKTGTKLVIQSLSILEIDLMKGVNI
jgi:hypothetical protein